MFDSLFSERGLSLDRLRVLVEVHDAGGIAQAVPGDPVRQSQYSRQLRELSEFFGVEVARRQGKLLKLTPQGSRLAELAREQMRSLHDFRAECRAESVDYKIAAGDSLLQWLVIPRLSRAAAGLKAIRFATYNLRTNETVQQLSEGRIDFGIIRRDAATEGLKSASLGKLAYKAIIPAALVKAGRHFDLGEMLSELPVATQIGDGQFTQRVREIAAKLKVKFIPALACQSFSQTLSAVRSGGFAAILPKLALTELTDKAYTIVEAPPLHRLDREIVLAWNPRVVRVRPGAARLAEQLRAHFRLDG